MAHATVIRTAANSYVPLLIIDDCRKMLTGIMIIDAHAGGFGDNGSCVDRHDLLLTVVLRGGSIPLIYLRNPSCVFFAMLNLSYYYSCILVDPILGGWKWIPRRKRVRMPIMMATKPSWLP